MPSEQEWTPFPPLGTGLPVTAHAAAVEGLTGGQPVRLQGRGSPFRYSRANPAACGPARGQRLAPDLTAVRLR